MLNLVTALAAAVAIQAAPAPVPAPNPHTLQNLPGGKIHYYKLSGQNGAALQKSLKSAMKAEPKTVGQLFTWTAKVDVTKETVGSVCTVKSATAALDANIYLPQLTDEAKIPANDLALWKAYEAGIQKDAAENLWFVAERLPAVGQSVVGKPCDQAAAIWNEGMTRLIAQQQAFDAERKKKAGR